MNPRPERRGRTGRQSATRCSECGSDNTRRLSVIYEQGTADTHYRGGFSGTSLGSVGINSIAGSYGGQGKVETRLAQRVAPPTQNSPGDRHIVTAIVISLICLGAILIVLFLTYGNNGVHPFWVRVLSLISFLLIVIMATVTGIAMEMRERTNRKYQREVYRPKLENWQQSYYCDRCGHIFNPKFPDLNETD